jgi:tetratricopeptide (TPR) repeat protein
VNNFSDSSRAEEYFERGIQLEDNGELEAALERYEEAVAEDPSFGDAYVEMAYIQLRLGDERRAVENLRRAIRVAGHPLAYYNLGWIYEGRERPERAEHLYRKAIESSPELSDAHLGLAMILLNSGRIEEAINHIDRAHEIEPDNSYIHFLRDSALPRFREFSRDLLLPEGISNLGLKEQVYLDFGAILLGSAGDDGVNIQATERNLFESPEEVAVTLNRFLNMCAVFKWEFTAVAAVDPETETLAGVLAERLNLPYWLPDQVSGPGRVLLVSASLKDNREYLAAIEALEASQCIAFCFLMGLSPLCARNLDYKSLPQVVGGISDGRPYWLGSKVSGEPVESVLKDLCSADLSKEKADEQVNWYSREHSHLNFPLWGLGNVRR